jgi:hypothetical protein
MADDGYTTIHRTTDTAQGELLAEMLRREGIDARFRSVSSTLIGMPASMIEMTVDVPVSSEARARQLLADLEYTGAAEELDRQEARVAGLNKDDVGEPDDDDQGVGEDVDAAAEHVDAAAEDVADHHEGGAASATDGASRARAVTRRRPIFAAGFAFFLPGGAHLYARRAWTALVVAAGVIACLAAAVTARSALTFEFAFAILAALVGCDAVGGVRAARAEARGEHRSRGRQLARGLALLGAAIAVGGGARFATGASHLIHTARLARYGVTCSDGAIVLENSGGDAREIEISHLQILASSWTGQERYDVGIKGKRLLDLAAGGHGQVTPDLADWLARSCGFPTAMKQKVPVGIVFKGLEVPEIPTPRSMYCEFAFSFAAREQPGVDAEPLGARGFCAPPRAPGTTAAGKLIPLR